MGKARGRGQGLRMMDVRREIVDIVVRGERVTLVMEDGRSLVISGRGPLRLSERPWSRAEDPYRPRLRRLVPRALQLTIRAEPPYPTLSDDRSLRLYHDRVDGLRAYAGVVLRPCASSDAGALLAAGRALLERLSIEKDIPRGAVLVEDGRLAVWAPHPEEWVSDLLRAIRRVGFVDMYVIRVHGRGARRWFLGRFWAEKLDAALVRARKGGDHAGGLSRA